MKEKNLQKHQQFWFCCAHILFLILSFLVMITKRNSGVSEIDCTHKDELIEKFSKYFINERM